MEKPVRSSFQYLSISYECALAIGNSLNLSEMLHEVIHTIVHKTNAHRGIIWVKNREQELKPVANAGINIEDMLAQGEIRDLKTVFNQIQKRQQFVLRYKDEIDFLQYCPVLTEKEESVLIVPVTNVAILYLVYAGREIADEPLANLLASLSNKLSVAIEACTAHENVIKEIQVREKAEKELTKKTEQLISSEKELKGLYGKSEQARKSLLSILEDVAQKEEALRESEERLDLAIKGANMGMWDWNVKTGDTTYSERWAKMLGYELDELAPDISTWETLIHPEDKDRLMEVLNQHFEDDDFEYNAEFRLKTKSGGWRWINSRGRVFVRDEEKKPLRMVGTQTDITERKSAEYQIKASLKENEVLLREIHHRVKNNLQVVSSLLDLQARGASNKDTIDALTESKNRLNAMALIHAQLYESSDLSEINMNGFVNRLLVQLLQSYPVQDRKITPVVNVADYPFPIQMAVPVGLILNELLSNALKYAFVDRKEGTIEVSLTASEEGRINLIVSDDGVGLPPGFDTNATRTLGLRLVKILTEDQLLGSLEFINKEGATFNIEFDTKY